MEHFLKITDKALIEAPMEIDYEYQLAGTITVEGAYKKSDNEGSFIYTYQSKFTSHIALIKGDKMIKAKDKRKWWQKLRNVLYGHEIDYEEFMPWLFGTKLDELIEEFKLKV